jgi:hypothetical protein
MSRPVRFLLSVLMACAVSTASDLSAQTVRGLVMDSGTGEAINQASVFMISEFGDTVAFAITAENGFYNLSAEDGGGVFVVIARALGYRSSREGPLEMEESDMQILRMNLDAQPLSLEGIVVEAARDERLVATGFYDRMAEGKGTFFTPEDIAISTAAFTPHLFREMDRVVPQYGAAPWRIWVKFRRSIGKRGALTCFPRIFIDGVWVNQDLIKEDVESAWGLDDLAPMSDLVAAEAFWGPFQAPLKYRGVSEEAPFESCGVILLWTTATAGGR